MQWVAYLYQAEALVSFLVAVLDRFLNCDLMCTRTRHVVDDLYPPTYVGCGQFRTDILVHLRFKRILSCWFAVGACAQKPAFTVFSIFSLNAFAKLFVAHFCISGLTYPAISLIWHRLSSEQAGRITEVLLYFLWRLQVVYLFTKYSGPELISKFIELPQREGYTKARSFTPTVMTDQAVNTAVQLLSDRWPSNLQMSE